MQRYSLTKGQLDDLKNAFKAIDVDGDGSITRRELTMLLRGMKQKVSEEAITHFIDRADTNRDGVISFPEFVTVVLRDSGLQEQNSGGANVATTRIEISGNRTTAKGPRYKYEPVQPEQPKQTSDDNFKFTRQYINNLQFAFYKSDKNGDGVLNRDEIKTLLRRLGVGITNE